MEWSFQVPPTVERLLKKEHDGSRRGSEEDFGFSFSSFYSAASKRKTEEEEEEEDSEGLSRA